MMVRLRLALCLLCLGPVVVAGGCSSLPSLPVLSAEGGSVQLVSLFNDDEQIGAGFDEVLYRHDTDSTMQVVLFDGPANSPTRAMVIRFFWRPVATRTPLDPSATNATMHYAEFEAGDELGIYSGAGFVYLNSKPGKSKLAAEIRESIVRLTDSTQGFSDRVIEGRLTGQFVARRDDDRVFSVLHRFNAAIYDRLGYPSLVELTPAASTMPALSLVETRD